MNTIPLTHVGATRPVGPACGPHCPEGCARCALTSALRDLGAGRVVVLPPGKYPTKIVSVGRAR